MATATYIDENGNKKQGTVQDNSLTGLYQKAYESNVSANEQQAAAAKAEAERQAAYAKETAAENYTLADKQAYTDYLRSIKALPEELAAYGINGGLAESSRVKLDTNYTGAVNENQRQRIAGERDINNQTAASIYQAQAAQAAADAEARQNLYSQQIALKQAQMENSATALASVGDYSGYVQLGYLTEEQAELMKQAWIAQNPELAETLYPSSTGNKSSGTYSPLGQAAAQLWASGTPMAEVVAKINAADGYTAAEKTKAITYLSETLG